MKHIYFELFILGVIIINSLKLVLDTYISGDSEYDRKSYPEVILIGNYLDMSLTVLFIVEALLKALAFGFVMDKNSYLRDSWS